MAKNAMIWGAAGGIGRALTDKLMTDGWTVIGVCRRPEEMETAVSHLLQADIRHEFAVQQAVLAASQEVETVDLWIYAAGDILSAKVGDLDSGDWQRILEANLSGAFRTLHHSLPLLAEDAAVVFLGAVSERLRLPGLSAYAAAKAGLEAFADALRKEERRKQIIVVRPGAVDTPLWDKVPLRLPQDAPSPAKVAGRILQAVTEGHQGQLDLVG